MPIKHGVYVYETDTITQASVRVPNSVQVIFGTAPVHVLDNPAAVTKKPILVNSAAEAKEKFGYSDDFETFTLCQAMHVMEKFYQVAPVVFVNLLDVSLFNIAVQEAVVSGGTTDNPGTGFALTVVNRKVIKSSIVLKHATGNDLYVEGVDYAVTYSDPNTSPRIIFLSQELTNAFYSTPGIKVKYDYLDVSLFDATVITDNLNIVNDIYPRLGVIPAILLAPKYSADQALASALCAKAANISGVFKAVAVLDLDTTVATDYTKVELAKTNGHKSPFCFNIWPCFKAYQHVIYGSVVAAMLMAYTDSQNDGIPSRSPSNKIIASLGVVSTCLADGTEVVLDQDQANVVNSYGVATGLYIGSWRLWGSYTGAYPDDPDPKNKWLPVRRMFNWQGNSFIVTYFDKVDDPINAVLIESVVDSENIRCMAYAPDHWAGARIRFVKSDNPLEDLLAGKITFRQSIAPYTPAQEINNILSYDTTMLQDTLYAVAVDE